MNRLVSLVMLVAFAVQQFACCCCVGAGTHTCDHDHCVADHVCEIEHNHDDHDSDGCGHEDSVPSNSEPFEHQSCPGDHSHQHHICVGTQVFFVSAARFVLPPQAFSLGLSFAAFDLSQHLGVSVCVSAAHYGDGSGPPLSSCPQRSALCVYRI